MGLLMMPHSTQVAYLNPAWSAWTTPGWSARRHLSYTIFGPPPGRWRLTAGQSYADQHDASESRR